MTTARSIAHIIEPQLVAEGAGVLLRRSFGPHRTNYFDPFLLFDHFAFNDPREGPIRGFPMHPHRGIETVTYMLAGTVNHRDSLGNAGLIGPGDAQWMTSGRGILHEELPRRNAGGKINGFQLWINLPAALKMSAPRYQDIRAEDIPSVAKEGAIIRLVAGQLNGTYGPVTEIAARPIYLEVTLPAGATFTYPVPRGHTLLTYVFEGAGNFGADHARVESVSMVMFDDGDQLDAQTDEGVRFILIAGAPFREPIVPYGPFVMNTVEEIQQAIMDFRNGTFAR